MASTDAVNTITESLKENDELPRKQIADIIEVLGEQVALELLAETRRVQSEGGLDVRDGTRRRTDGGVFFSLAKAKLPKTDRNRIFRIRPPKAPGSETGGAEVSAGAEGSTGSGREGAREKAGKGAPRDAERRPSSGAALPLVAKDSGGLGRRRVVEVEVLRHHAKPSPPPIAVGAPPPPPSPRPEERPASPEARPLRRIVVATPREEPPPATPDAARDRIRNVLRGLTPSAQRSVLAELLTELGGAEPRGRRFAEPAPTEQGGTEGGARAGSAGGASVDRASVDRASVDKERVLASVTEALGLTSGDLARALFGDDGPGARAKARVALERWRRT